MFCPSTATTRKILEFLPTLVFDNGANSVLQFPPWWAHWYPTHSSSFCPQFITAISIFEAMSNFIFLILFWISKFLSLFTVCSLVTDWDSFFDVLQGIISWIEVGTRLYRGTHAFTHRTFCSFRTGTFTLSSRDPPIVVSLDFSLREYIFLANSSQSQIAYFYWTPR